MPDMLTAHLLDILFRDPRTRRPWKDEVSTHLLDVHQAGTPITPHEIVLFLNRQHPAVLQELRRHPRVREELAALTPPSTTATP